MWYLILVGFLFIFLGLAVHVFKWYFLISGYNTMSKEKKANVDIKGLSRAMGIYSYINGILFILAGVLYTLGVKVVLVPAFVILGISTIYFLIRAQKYDGNIYDEYGRMRHGALKKITVPVGITIISLIFVAVLLFYSIQPTEITISDDGIKIHGMYGDFYTWDSIEKVELNENLPTIERRTNGSAVGSKLKGHFRTKELGPVKLFVDTEKPPFIYLVTNDRIIIFNMTNKDETSVIYREMLNKIKR